MSKQCRSRSFSHLSLSFPKSDQGMHCLSLYLHHWKLFLYRLLSGQIVRMYSSCSNILIVLKFATFMIPLLWPPLIYSPISLGMVCLFLLLELYQVLYNYCQMVYTLENAEKWKMLKNVKVNFNRILQHTVQT